MIYFLLDVSNGFQDDEETETFGRKVGHIFTKYSSNS